MGDARRGVRAGGRRGGRQRDRGCGVRGGPSAVPCRGPGPRRGRGRRPARRSTTSPGRRSRDAGGPPRLDAGTRCTRGGDGGPGAGSPRRSRAPPPRSKRVSPPRTCSTATSTRPSHTPRRLAGSQRRRATTAIARNATVTLAACLPFAGRVDEGFALLEATIADARAARAEGGGVPRVPDDRLVRVGDRRVRARRALPPRGHRLRRACGALERPALHGRAPRPRPVGNGTLVGGPVRRRTGAPRRPRRDHDPDHGAPRRSDTSRLGGGLVGRDDGPRRSAASRASVWASSSGSRLPCGASRRSALLRGDAAAAVRWSEAGLRCVRRGPRRRLPLPVRGDRGTRATSRPRIRPARTRFVDAVEDELRHRSIPGTLPAIEPCARAPRARRGGDRRGAAAISSWRRLRGTVGSAPGRASWARLDLARTLLRSNRRADGLRLVAVVEARAAELGSEPLADAARADPRGGPAASPGTRRRGAR